MQPSSFRRSLPIQRPPIPSPDDSNSGEKFQRGARMTVLENAPGLHQTVLCSGNRSDPRSTANFFLSEVESAITEITQFPKRASETKFRRKQPTSRNARLIFPAHSRSKKTPVEKQKSARRSFLLAKPLARNARLLDDAAGNWPVVIVVQPERS